MPHSRSAHRPIAVGATALALAVTVTPAVAAGFDICQVLPRADVEAAVGAKIGEVVPVAKPTSSELGKCDFRPADAKPGSAVIVASLAVIKPDKLPNQKKVWSEMMKTRPVDGIGDYAYLLEAGSAMYAVRGDKGVVVQVRAGAADRHEAIRRLARRALERL